MKSCVNCPLDRPLWNGNKCIPCPAGSNFNAISGKC